ncbi:recombination regulator RecX [Corynebacterium uropygiale]|uniref:Regulatory protein RecX n=1 Tax=Corynebacterium uropygiale TaxID=1775911 RepID=A0A9X1U0G5_9CORY|nr:regulatory protein RecX [Corynebacterium uropygiale]MCF4006453.1 recombination regulator RecX [Corynebacterium uropygiale]
MENQDAIARLRQALAEYAEGERENTILDAREEEAKAPVRERALKLLNQRARSREELRTRLRDLDFPTGVIEEVLDDLEGVGLINDRHFAEQWVRQRHERRGKSARMLDRELIAKGVASDIREDALSQITREDEESIAWAILEKKARRITSIPRDSAEYDKHLRRLLGMLARRGFPQGMSMALAHRCLDERLEELRQSTGGEDGEG